MERSINMMPANVSLDTVKYLKDMMVSIQKSIDYAYPYADGSFDEARAHTALQMANSKVKSIQLFLNSITENKETSTPESK
jgi:hypothetical protein